jgi:hypothetical protein
MTVQQRPTCCGRKNTFWMSVYCKEYMPMFAILLLLVNRKQSAPFNMNMSVVDVIQMLTVAQSLWSASKWLQPFEMYDAHGGLLGFTLHINNVAAWTKSWTTYRISHGKSGNSHGQGQCLVLSTWGGQISEVTVFFLLLLLHLRDVRCSRDSGWLCYSCALWWRVHSYADTNVSEKHTDAIFRTATAGYKILAWVGYLNYTELKLRMYKNGARYNNIHMYCQNHVASVVLRLMWLLLDPRFAKVTCIQNHKDHIQKIYVLQTGVYS